MALCQGPRSQMVILFFLVFLYIWQKDFAKTPKVPETPGNVNMAQSITYGW